MATSAEVKMNKSEQNIGIQFDQDQLSQISQLINNLQSQQVSVMNTIPIQNSQLLQVPNDNFEQLNDITFQEQTKNLMDTSEALNQNNFLNDRNQMEMIENTSYQMPNCDFQQENPNEVHTIILNGQPALFIPASSAMSSNLLCQMMTNQINPNQFDFSNNEISLQNQENIQTYQNEIINQTFNANSNINVISSNLTDEHNIFSIVGQNNNNTNINDIIGNLENLNQNTISLSSNQEVLTVNQSNDNNQEIMSIDKDEKHSFQEINSLNQQSQPNYCEDQSKTKIYSTKKIKKAITKNTVASALANSGNTKHAFKNKKPNKVLTKINNIKKSNEIHNVDQVKNFNPQSQGNIEQNIKVPKDAIQSNEANFMMNSESLINDIIQKHEKIELLYSNLNDTSNFTEEPKLKRKACECPNCVKWKTNYNEMSSEEISKKRTHNCHKCPKEYNKSSHLRAHLRAHDNYRPYICDFMNCGKSFTRSDELKRHKRIHNDDRNFICQICKKKFLRSDHLNKHLLVHNKSSNSSSSAISLLGLNNSSILDIKQKMTDINNKIEAKGPIKLENVDES